MAAVGGVAIALSVMFAALVVVLIAELFYVFYWKRRSGNGMRISSVDTERGGFDFDFSRESTGLLGHYPNSATADPLMVAKLSSEIVGTNSGLYMQGVLGGPRLLFTIKEETKEDMESEEASKTTTLQSKFYESDEESRTEERKNEQWQFAYTIGLMNSLRDPHITSYSDLSKRRFLNSSSDSSVSPQSCMFSHPSSPPPSYRRSSSLSSPSWRSSSCSPSLSERRFESPGGEARSRSFSRQSSCSYSVSTNPIYYDGDEFFSPAKARFSSQGTTPFGTPASSFSGRLSPPLSPPLSPIRAPLAAYSLPLLIRSLSRDSNSSLSSL